MKRGRQCTDQGTQTDVTGTQPGLVSPAGAVTSGIQAGPALLDKAAEKHALRKPNTTERALEGREASSRDSSAYTTQSEFDPGKSLGQS